MDALEILYIALAISGLLLILLLCVAVIQGILLLRDVRTVTGRVAKITEKVDNLISKPFMIFKDILQVIIPFIQKAKDRFQKKTKRPKGKES